MQDTMFTNDALQREKYTVVLTLPLSEDLSRTNVDQNNSLRYTQSICAELPLSRRDLAIHKDELYFKKGHHSSSASPTRTFQHSTVCGNWKKTPRNASLRFTGGVCQYVDLTKRPVNLRALQQVSYACMRELEEDAEERLLAIHGRGVPVRGPDKASR